MGQSQSQSKYLSVDHIVQKVLELVKVDPFNPVVIYLFLKKQEEAHNVKESATSQTLLMFIKDYHEYVKLRETIKGVPEELLQKANSDEFVETYNQEPLYAHDLIESTFNRLGELTSRGDIHEDLYISTKSLHKEVDRLFSSQPQNYMNCWSLLLGAIVGLGFRGNQARGREEHDYEGKQAVEDQDQDQDQDQGQVAQIISQIQRTGDAMGIKIEDTGEQVKEYLKAGLNVEEIIRAVVAKHFRNTEEEFNDWQNYIDAAEARVGREWTSERHNYRTELLRFMKS